MRCKVCQYNDANGEGVLAYGLLEIPVCISCIYVLSRLEYRDMRFLSQGSMTDALAQMLGYRNRASLHIEAVRQMMPLTQMIKSRLSIVFWKDWGIPITNAVGGYKHGET